MGRTGFFWSLSGEKKNTTWEPFLYITKGQFSPIFNLKIIISTYVKEFSI
jgi:hypothetical protein